MRRGAWLKKSKCLSSLPRKTFRKSSLPATPRCYKSFEKTFLERRPMWVMRLLFLPEWQSHFQLACTSGTKVSNNKDSPGSKPSSYPRLNSLQFNIIFARFFCSTGRDMTLSGVRWSSCVKKRRSHCLPQLLRLPPHPRKRTKPSLKPRFPFSSFSACYRGRDNTSAIEERGMHTWL